MLPIYVFLFVSHTQELRTKLYIHCSLGRDHNLPPSLSISGKRRKMSAIFWKNFYICFSKFKCLSTTLPPPSEEDSTTTLVKNFNSLYSTTSYTTTTTTSKSLTSTSSSHFFSSSDDSDDTTDHSSPPDFATIFASQRFFFSSPGHSNSILDSPPQQPHAPVTGGVAVQTYSPDPYHDFRQSMQEMVEAQQLKDVTANWEYLHELLLCYLNLNPQHTHKFIIGAFADLLISLMPETTTDDHRGRRESHHTSTTTLRLH